MKLVSLDSIFDIEYGNQLDSNKMTLDIDGVNYVSRSSKNLGIKGRVKIIETVIPYEAGLMTVTLGGSYLLSAFIQPYRFYTAQNIKVLRPKTVMSFNEKVFYCSCIKINRFKYSSHGREANKSLNSLLVPAISEIPLWVHKVDFAKAILNGEHTYPLAPAYKKYSEELVELDKIFEVFNGVSSSGLVKYETKMGPEYIPFVRPSKSQLTSFIEWVRKPEVDVRFIFPKHSLYVSTNGQGSHTYTYVSSTEFVPNSDVAVLIPRKNLTLQEKLFYAHAISLNRRLFSYGRKPKGDKLRALKIPLCPPPFVYEQNLFKKALKSN